jgi:hypothetical protein
MKKSKVQSRKLSLLKDTVTKLNAAKQAFVLGGDAPISHTVCVDRPTTSPRGGK